jgi:choice-of-anchor B domain-containing protein
MKNFSYFLFILPYLIFAQMPCNNGLSGNFPCNGYDLVAHLDLNDLNATSGNDSWGWTDPLDGKEYAIVGLNNGTAFIDISQPTSPVYLGKLPTHTTPSMWRDIKVYNNFAFVVSEASGHGMQVFDLTKLRNVTNPPQTFTSDAHYNGFGNAHNVAINPSQPFAYVVGSGTFNGGPHVIDISDPLNPVFAGGYGTDFYSHDAQILTYSGPDNDYVGSEIYIGSNEDELVILDVSDKSNITNISTISYSNIGYTHQAWLTEDERFLLLGDELDEISFGFNTRTIVFDLLDLDNPVVHMEYSANNPSIDHNGYVYNGLYYLSSYTAGLRVLDVTDIANQNISEVGFFDSFSSSDNLAFDGLWNAYPFFDSGNIVLSDINSGFLLVRDSTLSTNNPMVDQNLKLYPNPTRNFVNISAENNLIHEINIYDHLGKLVYAENGMNQPKKQVNIEHLQTGIYIVNINNIVNKRLVVQ